MIRVSYLLLGSGLIFYCWRLASHELAVSFQMCISIEMQTSHSGNRPQDTEWTAFLSAVSRIINDLNIGQAWPMVRVYHRFALRPVGDLGNDIYVPRVNSRNRRGSLYNLVVAVTVQAPSNLRPRSLQLASGTRSWNGTSLGSRLFNTWRLSDPLDLTRVTSGSRTPPNTPTNLNSSIEHYF